MIALRARCWGVISSDVAIDYLLDDCVEIFADLRLQWDRELPPEIVGLDGHNTSHCVASSTTSRTAASVSLVRTTGGDAIRLVTATGMRKNMEGRYATTTRSGRSGKFGRVMTGNRRPKSGCVGSVISISGSAWESGLFRGVLSLWVVRSIRAPTGEARRRVTLRVSKSPDRSR